MYLYEDFLGRWYTLLRKHSICKSKAFTHDQIYVKPLFIWSSTHVIMFMIQRVDSNSLMHVKHRMTGFGHRNLIEN